MEAHDVPPLRVAILDDHPILTQGLVALFGSCDDIHVTRITSSASELRHSVEYAADVLIVNLTTCAAEAIQKIRAVHANNPNVRLIAIACSCDSGFVREVLRAGALSFLLLDSSPDDLRRAVRSVYQGDAFFSQKVLCALIDFPHEAAPDASPSPTARLTTRECEVLALIAHGFTNAEIADTLQISKSTAQFHVHNLLGKLQVSTRTEAAVVAERLHLITTTG